eukprot:g10177.t1
MLSARWVLLFAGTALLHGLPAAGSLQLDPGTVERTVPTGVVPKTIESDEVRFVFMAGLEGSGHHYVLAVAKAVREDNPDLPRLGQQLNVRPFYVPTAMGGSASKYATRKDSGREAMRVLAEQAAGLPDPAIYFPKRALSYPQNTGPQKVMQYLDLRRMAEAAESEGLDVRVVYLKRSAQDMVISNTVHRQFQTGLDPIKSLEQSEEDLFMEYMRIFFTDVAVLHSFLAEIDPGFIVCHDWNRVGDETQASEIAAFVSPNGDIAYRVYTAMIETAANIPPHEDAGGIDELTFEGAESVISRLQDKLDSFEALYCG